MLKSIQLMIVIAWISWTKLLLSALLVERTARQFCKKKLTLNRKLDNAKLGFQSDVRIFVIETLTHYNQNLAWKCRELKQADKIRSFWSAKGVVKVRRILNERPIAVTHDTDIASLWPDFVFKERTRSWWSGCCFAFHSLMNYDCKESLKYTKQKQHVIVIM